MGPFWAEDPRVKPWLHPGYADPRRDRARDLPEQMDVIQKEALCIICGCCVSECNSMEADPDFLGPAALAKGMRFVGDPRDETAWNGSTSERRARDLGLHAVLLLQRALPEGRRPARRDRQARRRVGEGGHRLGHGREAREVVRHLHEDDRLAARDRARPEDAGHRRARSRRRSSRCSSRKRGKVPPPGPHVAADVDEARELYDLVKEQGRDGALGIVQGESGARRDRAHRGSRNARDEGEMRSE